MALQTQSPEFVEKFKDAFDQMTVYKDSQKNAFIASFKLPSFMRDWVLKKFQDEDGEVDVDGALAFIQEFIPKKEDWKDIMNRIVNNGETVQFLAKISVNIDIATQAVSFALPDFGLGFQETIITPDTWRDYSADLLKAEENWGIVELCYLPPQTIVKPFTKKGKVRLVSFQDFCPYVVDVDDFRYARADFTLDEWIDILLGAADYNPAGYAGRAQKLLALQRLLPFVEKRVNLAELAPAGTGKSYLFGQISRYGWLVSGKVTRAKLIYDFGRKKDGVVAFRDFVALDEIREAGYMEDTEIQSALQAIMENGFYRAPDNHQVNVDAGILFLGNIGSEAMSEWRGMFDELPRPFHQPQFLDRIHGFIKGWELPRMTDDLKACGWALNTEFFATVLHDLRDDPTYRTVVDSLVEMPRGSDTRDTEAVKRICTALLKLLFPNVRREADVDLAAFQDYCLKPAMEMRQIIRIQMGHADVKYQGSTVPEFTVRGLLK